jgi:hypothetical protein
MDTLCSSYGWSYDDVLNKIGIYDLMCLSAKINKRKKGEYLMLATIALNPHTKEPKALIDELTDREYVLDDYYDKQGLERLKTIMGAGRGLEIKS